MKNFSKILILVLSLALILGSIMIITSAESVEGWYVKRDIDFTGVKSEDVANNNKYASSGQLNFNINNFDSSLEHSIQTNPADGNTYWQVKAYNKSSQNEYFSPGYGGGWFSNGSSNWSYSNGVHTPGKNAAQDFPYLIYQIDVMAPTGYFSNSSIATCYRFPKSGAAGNGTGSAAITLLNDAYGSYVGFNGAKLYVDPYEFTTITVIAQAKLDATKAYSYLNVYVNGKFFGTKLDYTFTGFEGFNPSTPNFSWEDIRLQFVSSGDGVIYDSSLAIDNMKFVLVGKDYAKKTELEALITNKANLTKDNDYATAWTENVYTGERPEGVTPSTTKPVLTMTTDFNSLADTWGGSYGGSTSANLPTMNGGFGGPTSYVVQRSGAMSIFKSEYDPANKAIVFTPTAGQASSSGDDPYYQIYPAPVPNKNITSADVRGNMFNDSYYVVDLDVLAPSGKFVNNAQIQMAIQAANASGSNGSASYGGNMVFGFGNDSSGNYVFVKDTTKGKHYISDISNNWAHLTYVMKMIPDKAKGSIAIEQYLYCDGVQVIKVTGFTVYRDVDTATDGYQYYNNIQLMTLKQLKFAYGGSNNTTESLAYDNFMLRMYDNKYDGNLSTVIADKTKNLSTWEGNVYDESEMPYGFPVVEVDGTKYDDGAKASAAMAAMGDNAAATMIAEFDVAFSCQGKVYYTTEAQRSHIKAASGYHVSDKTFSDGEKQYVLICENARKTSSGNFNGIADTWGGAQDSSSGPAYSAPFSWLIKGRSGKTYAFKSPITGDTNKAVVFESTGTHAGSTDPYAYVGYDTNPGNGTEAVKIQADDPVNMVNNSYYVIDLDVMSPSGELVNSAYIKWNAKYRKATSGNRDFVSFGPGAWAFGYNATDGNYVYNNGAASTIYPLSDITNWKHITIILDVDVQSDGTLYGTNYLYIDGNFVAKRAGKIGGAPSTYYNNNVIVSMNEIKFGFSLDANNPGSTIAYDNVSVRAYANTYKGNLAEVLADDKKSITEWEGNVYDESKMPYGVHTLVVDGKNYDSATEAFEALYALDEPVATMADVDVTFPKEAKVYYTEGQLAHIKAASGYSVVGSLSDASGTYALIVKSPTVHYDYHWGAGCCDDAESHLLSQSSYVGFGEKITSKFVSGDYADAYILRDGKIVKHTGWKFLTKNGDSWTVGAAVGDATVDIDMVNAKDVYLVPVYTEADVTGKSYAVVKPDTKIAKLYDNTLTLKQIFSSTYSANTDIIMLLSDVSYDPNAEGNGTIGAYGRTLDINGFTLDVRNDVPIAVLNSDGKTYDNNKNKIACFNYASGFTVTSSKVGGKIFNACTQIASSARCTAPFISSSGNVTFKAASHDHLAYYGGTIVQNWDGYMQKFVVDGGSYFATQSDNTGFFHLTTVKDAEIKNALVVTKHSGTIYVSGRNQASNTSSVLVDNCIFIADGGSIIQHSYDKATILFTNCYLDGNINANSSHTGIPKGQITIGAGNYIGGELGTGVVFADDVVKYDVNSYFKISYKYNEYKTNPNFGTSESENKSNRLESDLELFDKTSYSEYTAYTGAADLADVTVNLRDEGDYVGKTYIKSGMILSARYVVEVVVSGWVNREATWYASYFDKPVTETVTIDYAPKYELVEAFTDTIYYVYEFKDQLGFYAYLPVAPEGIEYVSASYDATGTRTDGRYADLVATTIGGRRYNKIRGCWPGVAKLAAGVKTIFEFKYDGQTFTYTSPNFTLADYLDIVIDNEENQYTEAEINFAYGLARYTDQLLTIRNKADAKIKAYAEASPLKVLPEGFGETAYSGADISQYVSIHLNVYDARIRFAATVTDAKYKVKFMSGSSELTISPKTLVKNTTTVYESGEYQFHAVYDKTFDIVVYEGDTEVARASGYNLSYYAAAMAAYDTANGTNYYDVVCSMYEFGAAQAALRASRS